MMRAKSSIRTDAASTGLVLISASRQQHLLMSQQWHAATNASYNIQSHIKGTDRKAGNVLSLEGGVGRTFCSGLCNAGVDYYTQWKVTNDKFPNVPPGFVSKHRYYGVGPETNGVLPINAKTLAIFKLAYFQEVGKRGDARIVGHYVGHSRKTKPLNTGQATQDSTGVNQ
jgi:hypothetical protein